MATEYKDLPATAEFWKTTWQSKTKAWLKQTLTNNKAGIQVGYKTKEQIKAQNIAIKELLK